jgi:glutamate racemase
MNPIGVFDSGYGGLTILKEIRTLLPQYDYIYLGDNARTPYGSRSFEVVYSYTLEAVRALFEMGCRLVILACNTASAKALRSIQQRDLPGIDPERRVLGVIRPSVESVRAFTRAGCVGVLATSGTVISRSYELELKKIFPEIKVTQQACPMWVPLVENNEHTGAGADYFAEKYISALMKNDPDIDAIILACTHYPLMIEKIKKFTPEGVNIIPQGPIVADSLRDYLRRHPEMEQRCSKGGRVKYLTSENPEIFSRQAALFLGAEVEAERCLL